MRQWSRGRGIVLEVAKLACEPRSSHIQDPLWSHDTLHGVTGLCLSAQ